MSTVLCFCARNHDAREPKSMEIHQKKKKKYFILDQKGVSISQPIFFSQEPWLPAQVKDSVESCQAKHSYVFAKWRDIFESVFPQWAL